MSLVKVSRRVLLVNVTATLGVDLPPGTAQEDIEAELEVKNLSADDAIDMLASQPDRFLGRTTKVRQDTDQERWWSTCRTAGDPSEAWLYYLHTPLTSQHCIAGSMVCSWARMDLPACT